MKADLDLIWDHFMEKLFNHPPFYSVKRQLIAGTPFLYIETVPGTSEAEVRKTIFLFSKKAMLHKKVTSETIFVRNEENLYVYRHRFYVPLEKMFCCGNLCSDCILLK
ncbi:hypothetical protein [Metabacillus sp. 84]|uniref:hypothetical protein n=1 Tax=unclassified Metabacillus TaxID=2675274 RepID=UPI003CF7D94D